MAMVFMLSGCGEPDPLNRQPVSGTVTLDGSPVRQGSISFAPAAGSGEHGGGAAIDNGRFSLPARHGLPPGRYIVRISAVDGLETDDPGVARPATELIPQSWNVKSEHEVEITDGGRNNFTFEISSSD
jgi:hypothetical protein